MAMSATKEVKILLYCQNPIALMGFARIFEAKAKYRVAQVSNPDSALGLSGQSQPDAVILDFDVSVDLLFLQRLRRCAPEAKLILWAGSIAPEMAFQAFKLGVVGILPKTLQPKEFLNRVQAVLTGQVVVEKSLSDSVSSASRLKLTRRESELVTLIGQGLRNKEIAFQLSITEYTVKAYLTRLFQKLNVDDRHGLAVYALTNLTNDLCAIRERLGTRPGAGAGYPAAQNPAGSISSMAELAPSF
jgi:DNA-binding NarL/FixJ family response regulator